MRQPKQFNIAGTICRRHKDAVYRIALQDVKIAGINTYTFGGLDFLSDKFAMILSHCGIKSGDVIATLLPQGAAFVVAHLAILKVGAIVTPISVGIEQTEIESLLEASDTKIVVADETIYPQLSGLGKRVPQVEQVFVACDYTSRNDFGEGFRSFWYEVNFADSDFTVAQTYKSTPAYLFYEGENNYWQKHTITHGQLAESCTTLSTTATEKQSIFWTSNAWASRHALSGMLYPVWYQGSAAASYEPRGKSMEESLNLLKEMGLEIIVF